MRKSIVIGGIVLIAIGKIFLVGGILSQEGLQKCLSLDPSIMSNPGKVGAPICMDDSMNFFIVSIIFLAAGAFTLIYGLKSKSRIKQYP
jgi:hypothetical protein